VVFSSLGEALLVTEELCQLHPIHLPHQGGRDDC
jgi:hypothetical protein